MKTTAALVLMASSAAAFAPATKSASMTALKASDYDSMIGIDVETGKKFFDPWGLSGYIPAKWAREAELSNGRSAMLATVGYVFPAYFGTFDSTDVTTTDPIDAILQADPQWWAQFILLCGAFEGVKYRCALEGKTFTGIGEPAVDYANLYPKEEAKRADMHLKELKNGRLAMIGIAGFVSNHFIPGAVPGAPHF
uniref:Plastid light harvesting protein n=1 Tax=Eucampia antarctica TaxID=49252 RepID=A0A7S2R2M8_9STRA|mmetsp:Transcript_14349/g.13871  ORF Transcript_14349/g.13871 Transcript_14349/m.13871 type:complete len:195 (+) Transcript_14349:86-670(+)|eukprot:CAMPEP_0197824958 /NCGR_PEP_ID=MMETSP1437-20131217/2130_1 /TAXON_ID=49252 ORGANISM="Eucampia antarctica, Strain CCMP1452" /NCGR_SAMPLE_ID=MMETSP1437 /ASSEMBLY_ACC=CAM_ASM_001096 /LENGTH=194 /DNA_ID=CAMNT_0043424779 /DNA_START=84 /DNA_END=668 /DNA_ORIENTATION=+